MLIEKIQQAKEVIEKSGMEQLRQQQHDQYVQFLQVVKEEKPKFLRFFASMKAFQEELSDVAVVPAVENIMKQVGHIIDTYEREPQKRKMTQASAELEKVDKELQVRWKQVAHMVSKDIIHTLQTLQKLVPHDSEIPQIISTLQHLIAHWPIEAKNVAYFKQLVVRGKEKIQTLDASETVQAFLEKATNNQATLMDVTPEIMTWLQERDLAKNLRIFFG